MKKILTVLFVLIFTIQISSQQLTDVYVLSEGGFSAGPAMLSHLDVQSSTFTQDIFNLGLGVFPDGLVIHEENLYLTEQGSFGGAGKIYKLELDGTVISSQEVGTNPYSLAIANDKVYVTNGPASNVSILNLADFSFVKDVSVGVYPQEILGVDNKIFVANNSAFGGDEDSTVTVIDAATDEVIETINVKKNPSSLALTNDNHLLVGCPGDESVGVIYKVNLTTYEKVDTFTVPGFGFGKDLSIDKNSNNVYFKGSTNDIIELNMANDEVKSVVSDAGIALTYGYGFDYLNQNHYILDAKDFASNGSLTVYASDGSLQNTYETSFAPRRVVFNYGSITDVEDTDLLPAEFALQQNYPNPFNPSTSIRYQVSTTENVLLKIYDALGREVTTLVNELQPAGVYEARFDASNLSSGIYFYSLTADDFHQIKKMMLIK